MQLSLLPNCGPYQETYVAALVAPPPECDCFPPSFFFSIAEQTWTNVVCKYVCHSAAMMAAHTRKVFSANISAVSDGLGRPIRMRKEHTQRQISLKQLLMIASN